MSTSVVLGLGFGDEGKGLTTSYLASACEPSRTLVVRFCGGHQAGHTVWHKGHKHVFSSFGAATLQGVATLWSRFCTFYPNAVCNEYEALQSFRPQLLVDNLCPVTTPFDRLQNQLLEGERKHGSCGVGFGATLQRHENFYKLYVQDLYFESVLKAKLQNILEYYANVLPPHWKEIAADFLTKVEQVKSIISPEKPDLLQYENVVFEGAQGILLDMDFGFFPNVTRSNTTAKNALTLISEWQLPKPTIYYITRSYQTRHGNGFMSNEDMPQPRLINNADETNITNEWQGEFRKTTLDADLLNYALLCDSHFTGDCPKKLVVTCLDQTQGQIPFTAQEGKVRGQTIAQLLAQLRTNFGEVWQSRSPDSTLERWT